MDRTWFISAQVLQLFGLFAQTTKGENQINLKSVSDFQILVSDSGGLLVFPLLTERAISVCLLQCILHATRQTFQLNIYTEIYSWDFAEQEMYLILYIKLRALHSILLSPGPTCQHV